MVSELSGLAPRREENPNPRVFDSRKNLRKPGKFSNIVAQRAQSFEKTLNPFVSFVPSWWMLVLTFGTNCDSELCEDT